MISLEELVAKLASLSSAIIATHVSPDPDAIGSALALERALAARGVSVCGYFPESIPNRFAPLIVGCQTTTAIPSAMVDAIVVVDTASRARVGSEVTELLAQGKEVIVIDHHVSNEGWGDVNYVDPVSPASACIVAEILAKLGCSITPQIANLLYAGILDDTGCFRFSNTSAQALIQAAELISKGAQAELVSNTLYFNVPQRMLTLKAKALSTLGAFEDGKVSLLYVDRAMLAESGATAEDSEGLIDIARSIEGTLVAVFMRELEEGWKFSLRSKDSAINVHEIAALFGGGGHKAAAGCKIDGTRAEVTQKILEAIHSAIR